jgi:hypothetical protein
MHFLEKGRSNATPSGTGDQENCDDKGKTLVRVERAGPKNLLRKRKINDRRYANGEELQEIGRNGTHF